MSNFSSTIQNQIPTPNLPIKLQLGLIGGDDGLCAPAAQRTERAAARPGVWTSAARRLLEAVAAGTRRPQDPHASAAR